MEALDVDEVVGQLLASEGFGSVEELAVVDEKELAGIEGFDEDTARELQSRAQEYLGKIEGELDAKRTELGVEDAVKEVPGVTTAMLVKFGENGVKTVEDLAGCATDDLVGWTERKDGESKREPGFLDGIEISREDAEAMIMQARVKAGWITEADLAKPAEEALRPKPKRRRLKQENDRTDAGRRARHKRRARRRTAQGRSPAPSGCARCPATVKPVDELIRFVVGPHGVVADLKRKLPGRGLWISADRHTLKDAVARNVFARGFKRELRVSQALVEETERLLVRAALDALAIAGKAGAGGRRVRQGRGGDRAGGHRRADPCVRCRRRRGRQARRRAAPAGGRRPGQADQGFHDGPIGFGIGPVKCGTCSPACRACK